MRPCQTTPPPAKTITFEHKCGNIYVQYTLRPKLHSTDSLKIQIFPMSDFENGVARLLQLTRFGEVALRLLFVTM